MDSSLLEVLLFNSDEHQRTKASFHRLLHFTLPIPIGGHSILFPLLESTIENDPKLVKIKGWQVLAIGNIKTPSDWSLKDAIFLSLEEQAKLGFRVVNFLPYDSYVRKTVGYLFAIQHGAKKIFDADDRGEVIDGDLGKHFDVELVGEDARQETIMRYSHENPNRTLVNPYSF
ncbi:hypothetical protein G4B88_028272 [Cannabis sativa]|uniref:Uncharacterized protein n=1 Tax=Cannabis sativa TaxID=3483 RepID=A0A7J6GFJ8_CANSA|nr:hypothetical protein G4B88_028272 [Cannabis sativa]